MASEDGSKNRGNITKVGGMAGRWVGCHGGSADWCWSPPESALLQLPSRPCLPASLIVRCGHMISFPPGACQGAAGWAPLCLGFETQAYPLYAPLPLPVAEAQQEVAQPHPGLPVMPCGQCSDAMEGTRVSECLLSVNRIPHCPGMFAWRRKFLGRKKLHF